MRTRPRNHSAQSADVGNRRSLVVEYMCPTALRSYANNPKKHRTKQLDRLVRSMREFGFTNPILIDEKGEIIAGHGRLEAALLLGLDQVPVIRLCGLTDAQKRAYRIADNKLAETGTNWSLEKLNVELESLRIEGSLDIEVTGFDISEAELLFDQSVGDDDV
jgi:ParB family transcriptional regulator, chromosome partitioning protein